MNNLRGKANAITADSAKFVNEPAAIDFSAYKSKLRFTGAAVADLEKVYSSTKLPEFTASLPSFEAQKRAAMMEVVTSTVAAAKADLELLRADIAKFESSRMTIDTSTEDLKQRFPAIAKEVETEIKDHQWFKSITQN